MDASRDSLRHEVARGQGSRHPCREATPRSSGSLLGGVIVAIALLLASTARPTAAQDGAALYEQACEEGELVACNLLGLMFEVGYGDLPVDLERAATLYDRACAGGDAEGCTNLGLMYLEGRFFETEVARAAELWAGACDDGEPLACDYLGGLYQAGEGVSRDFVQAVSLYEQACEGELLIGCVHFATMALVGIGTPRDPVRALAYYDRACAGGEMVGCLNLGVSHERGDGTIRDPAAAVPYYQRACEGGEELACANLGSLYRRGEGVPEDLARAASLYEQACGSGVMVGCTNLAAMYQSGEGVRQDIALAIELYTRACFGGARAACAQVGLEPVDPVGEEAEVREVQSDLFEEPGTVADSQTGAGLDEAVVTLPALGIRVISDAEGRVALPPLPAGRHALVAERSGYDDIEGELAVPGQADFVVLLNPSALDVPEARGTVLGRVSDESNGRGIQDVEIVAAGTSEVVAVSNGQGRFTLLDVEPGLVELRFRRLGYAPRDWMMVVQPGRTVEISAEMSTEAIELDPILVVAERSAFLEQTGFYDRARTSWGNQITHQQLMELDPIYFSDVLWGIPGITVIRGPFGAQAVTTRGGRECYVTTFLDGIQVDDFDLDGIAPEQIEAIEVYRGLAVPIQYGPPGTCGIILLWTRRGR